MKENLIKYILGIADNSLILGQRLSELCGHGPSLETDIALTNISLDLLGQTRSYFQYAAKLKGENTTEDDLAFLRKERQYLNALLVEQPNGDFAHTIVRQFLFDGFHLLFLEQLRTCADTQLAAIAEKSIKEVKYHFRFSSEWVKRLGDGTEESHEKMQVAINDLWIFTNELFLMTDAETAMHREGIGVDLESLRADYQEQISEIVEEATLQIPETKYWQKGGKQGIHSEQMGYILADMQYMQRAYPNMQW